MGGGGVKKGLGEEGVGGGGSGMDRGGGMSNPFTSFPVR